MSKEQLSLKWGTLKEWELNKDGEAYKALQRYEEAGQVSMSAMAQHDNAAQKQALCELIDALDADTVHLDWDGKHVSKDEAKAYVMGYDL